MRLVVLYFVIIMAYSCGQIEKDKAGKVSFSTVIEKWEKQGDFDFLLVKTTLTNSTEDTLSYVSMSCSWQESYTTDNKDLSVLVSPCDKNVPVLIKIFPHKREEATINLMSKRSREQLRGLKFRIGFNLITVKDQDDIFTKVSDLRKMENVIWSDTLQVN